MQFRVSKTAQRDLEEIFLYWARRVSTETADNVVERITERFSLLANYPGAGKACDVCAGVRCFPAGKYLIYYPASSQMTDIVHIFHGARDRKRALIENETESG